MGTLKQFIVQEELKISHADRYLTFVDRFHSEVFLDLKHELEAIWKPIVEKLNKKYKFSDQEIQEIQVVNPKATIQLDLVTKSEKLISSRAHRPIEVSPSVKIPLRFKPEQRDLVLDELISAAHKSMLIITDRWKEIFSFEKHGKLSPWFKILVEKNEIRMQLALSNANEHSYRTLYSVLVDYGRSGSKLKDFNRIYLTTSIGT
jgi:hypothetical protein